MSPQARFLSLLLPSVSYRCLLVHTIYCTITVAGSTVQVQRQTNRQKERI